MKILMLLSLLIPTFLYADLSVKEVGWNTYKRVDGKYFINDVLVHQIPKNITPDVNALDEDKCWSENYGFALAFFSNMVTLRTNGSEMCNGMAHPNHWASVNTYQVNNGKVKEVTLSDLFSREDILEQLYKDSYLTEKYPVDTKKHIKRDFEKINHVCEAVDTSTLKSFTIHHIKGDQVAIRLFLKACGNGAVKMSKQIGFYLPAYGPLFEAINLSSENKLLMKDLSPD